MGLESCDRIPSARVFPIRRQWRNQGKFFGSFPKVLTVSAHFFLLCLFMYLISYSWLEIPISTLPAPMLNPLHILSAPTPFPVRNSEKSRRRHCLQISGVPSAFLAGSPRSQKNITKPKETPVKRNKKAPWIMPKFIGIHSSSKVFAFSSPQERDLAYFVYIRFKYELADVAS